MPTDNILNIASKAENDNTVNPVLLPLGAALGAGGIYAYKSLRVQMLTYLLLGWGND